MALLLTIVAPLVASIVPLFLALNGDNIIPSCQDVVFLVPLLLKILPSFIYARSFPGLNGLGAVQSGGLTLGRLRFFGLRLLGLGFFGGESLGLDFWQSDMRRAVAHGAMGIQISNHGAGSSARLGLGVDCSLYHLFKVHGFLVLLLHLYFNRRLEPFLKIANHGEFIGDLDKVELRQDGLETLKVGCSVLSFF